MISNESVQTAISTHLNSISDLLLAQSEEMLNAPQNGKWTIAEHAIHLNKSVAPINMAMGLPKLTLFVFGKVSFSRSFEEIRQNYISCLSTGAKATKAYIPIGGKNYEKDRLISDLRSNYDTYLKRIMNWNDADLDIYRLPHPILGKLTMREMAFFTQYHLEHHFNTMNAIANI